MTQRGRGIDLSSQELKELELYPKYIWILALSSMLHFSWLSFGLSGVMLEVSFWSSGQQAKLLD